MFAMKEMWNGKEVYWRVAPWCGADGHDQWIVWRQHQWDRFEDLNNGRFLVHLVRRHIKLNIRAAWALEALARLCVWLCCLFLMLQAALLDCPFFDLFPFSENGFVAAEVDVCGWNGAPRIFQYRYFVTKPLGTITVLNTQLLLLCGTRICTLLYTL